MSHNRGKLLNPDVPGKYVEAEQDTGEEARRVNSGHPVQLLRADGVGSVQLSLVNWQKRERQMCIRRGGRGVASISGMWNGDAANGQHPDDDA